MKHHAWLWALLPLIAGACVCGVPSNLAFCDHDSDCASGQSCSDGVCVGGSVGTDSGVCTPATECPTSFCGSFDAGCGNSLECSCPNGLRCGASGVPNVCGACDADAGDLPDDFFLDSDCDGIDGKAAQSIFVSPAGSDQNDGGRFAPLKTVPVAIAVASGRPVLMDEGEYDVSGFVLTTVASLHGGYRSDAGWARDANTLPVFRADATGLRVEAADASVVFDRCEVNGADSDGGAGGFSAAVFVRGSDDVQLLHCALEAGKGAVGNSGTAGVQGRDGDAGGDGAAGADTGSGGGGVGGPAGRNPECIDAIGADGGRGGAGLSITSQDPGAPGDQSAGAADGGNGGPATCTTCACANGDGGMGARGSDGAPGSSGSGGTGFGTFSFADGGIYSAPRAGTGGKGGNGIGGGGGGGGASAYVTVVGTCSVGTTPTGGGGGGAGAGGCGGLGGVGGVGGGPSIALVVLQSHVFVGASVLRTRGGGNGGEGGRGGNGGVGGPGGNGGKGGSNAGAIAGSGGAGGRGGDGARGGPGGGGVGGFSLGVYCEGATLQLVDAGTSLGAAGQGGVSTGIAGSTGQASATLGCP